MLRYSFKTDSGGAEGASSLRIGEPPSTAADTGSPKAVHTNPFPRSQGADVTGSGVLYRTWSDATRVAVCILDEEGKVKRSISLEPEDGGYWSVIDPAGRPGDLYGYAGNGIGPWPDPASRFQPFGVHGPSMVVDPSLYHWNQALTANFGLADLVIYELHIGTFTTVGTFLSAIEKLPHLVALGVTAIELMPIADFPGERNWGYDGVSLYAPSRTYGTPDELRMLVDAAHEAGLRVILDVVYNHLGPDGNYIISYHKDYFNSAQKTPWGDALQFEKTQVRDFFVENALYWRHEFRFDGFRLDATHAILDTSRPHILSEISDAIHSAGGFVIAEDERRALRLLQPTADDGLGFDACWADDFHHIVHVMLTGEREGYYSRYGGTAAELADTLLGGWLPPAATNNVSKRPAGTDPSQFVFTLSNHDQVGNRALGERLGHLVSAASYRAASALLCLGPQTPLLFMGQEWNASTPFQFFTDHHLELGKQITEGRKHEFRHFTAFADAKTRETIPDPQARATFLTSKLRWSETAEAQHAGVLRLYTECLKVRRVYFRHERPNIDVKVLSREAVAIFFDEGSFRLAVIADLNGGCESSCPSQIIGELPGREWTRLLSSNEVRFAGTDQPPADLPRTEIFIFQRHTDNNPG
jgi:maltooligosyltrehalose trehalohydrolase